MLVLDPTAAPPVVDPDRGPDAGPLTGKRVGIRYDLTWRSFLWTTEEWQARLEAAGAEVVSWCSESRQDVSLDDAVLVELENFTTDVDIAIVGLGN
ncbi:hypothetical protein [Candidatus Poriferisocius sp.]|uniref:hypothetical protein n=1 Tax=Candidatus Poriferisocius sp. TaxID=3101276 RepID=UPI003B5A362B